MEQMVRLYALSGAYAGRVLWVDEFLTNDMVRVCLKDGVAEFLISVPMEMLKITTDGQWAYPLAR